MNSIVAFGLKKDKRDIHTYIHIHICLYNYIYIFVFLQKLLLSSLFWRCFSEKPLNPWRIEKVFALKLSFSWWSHSQQHDCCWTKSWHIISPYPKKICPDFEPFPSQQLLTPPPLKINILNPKNLPIRGPVKNHLNQLAPFLARLPTSIRPSQMASRNLVLLKEAIRRCQVGWKMMQSLGENLRIWGSRQRTKTFGEWESVLTDPISHDQKGYQWCHCSVHFPEIWEWD